MSFAEAKTNWQRYLGLIGRKSLALGDALFIPRCKRIHTWFMRFAIDAVFVDENGKIVKIFENLKPWSITPRISKAIGVLELAPGGAKLFKFCLGKKCIIDEY